MSEPVQGPGLPPSPAAAVGAPGPHPRRGLLIAWIMLACVAAVLDIFGNAATRTKLKRFNASVRTGLRNVQPLALANGLLVRLGDRYHWSVHDWEAPFNVTQMHKKLLVELGEIAATKPQEPFLSRPFWAQTPEQQGRQQAWDEYDRKLKQWQSETAVRRATLNLRYPKVVLDYQGPDAINLAGRPPGKYPWEFLLGIPDATLFMVNRAWAGNWFSRLILVLIPGLVLVLLIADYHQGKANGNIFMTILGALFLCLVGILLVSVLAWIVLWLITLVTYLFDGVLQLAAVIIGLGSFPILFWLGVGGLDLFKHMVGERVSSLIDKGRT